MVLNILYKIINSYLIVTYILKKKKNLYIYIYSLVFGRFLFQSFPLDVFAFDNLKLSMLSCLPLHVDISLIYDESILYIVIMYKLQTN